MTEIQKKVRDEMSSLAVIANLAYAWAKEPVNEEVNAYRLNTLCAEAMAIIAKLSPYVEGYVPGNLKV